MIKIDIEKLRQKKLRELKIYVAELLAPMDYIIVKIAEAQALGDMNAVEQLKQKYATQLQQRQTIRQWNKQTEQAIQNAKTIEELEAIKIEFEG